MPTPWTGEPKRPERTQWQVENERPPTAEVLAIYHAELAAAQGARCDHLLCKITRTMSDAIRAGLEQGATSVSGEFVLSEDELRRILDEAGE